MKKREKTCGAKDNKYFDQPCEGPLWESKGYFIDGQSDYRCEKHAKEGHRMNFAGPVYKPMKVKTA